MKNKRSGGYSVSIEDQKSNVLQDLGLEVRRQREAYEITLDDIFEKTYIRPEYISGIEDGDYRALPDTVYTLGFIRTYLKLLRMDALYPEFSMWLKKSARSTEKGPELFGQYAPPPPGFKLASRFWIFVVLLLTVVGAMTYVAYSWSRDGFPSITSATSRNEPAPVIETPAPQSGDVEAEVPPPPPPPPAAPAGPPKPSIKILALDDCWISIRIGNKEDQITLKKDETLERELTAPARVTYGRPWLVVVTLNGKDIGSPFTGGTKRSQANFYNPDGKHGKVPPAAKPAANTPAPTAPAAPATRPPAARPRP